MNQTSKSKPESSQTLVLFTISLFTIIALMGLGLDMGLLYIHKAKLSRASDAAVLAGIQNAAQGPDAVSDIMRNMAAANYPDLNALTPTFIQKTAVPFTNTSNNSVGIKYLYTYNDINGTFNTYMINSVEVGNDNKVTGAATDLNFKVGVTFAAIAGINRTPIVGNAKAKRGPRMIQLVLDRSGSMIDNGGYQVLPPAVSNFLTSFIPEVDAIGISSFGFEARLESPMSTNFYVYGANAMDFNNTNGIKFGGATCASEGIRMGIEMMYGQSNAWNDPNTLKYLVIFTDGQFNGFRSLIKSDGMTNVIFGPPKWMPGLTNVSMMVTSIPQQNRFLDFADLEGWGSTRYNATNIVTSLSPTYYQNVWITNYPGSVTYLLTSHTPYAKSLSNYDHYHTNNTVSSTNFVSYLVTNTTISKVWVSPHTSIVKEYVQLSPGDYLLQYTPGYSNLDLIVNMYGPHTLCPNINLVGNFGANDYGSMSAPFPYTPMHLWKKNDGPRNGIFSTNVLMWNPGVSTNDLTNGYLYYSNGVFWPGYTNLRITNTLGVPFTNGMKCAWIRGQFYTNVTKNVDGSSTDGIYTNVWTNSATPLFNQIIMLKCITNPTYFPNYGDTNMASFVYVNNKLYINPIGYPSHPQQVFWPSTGTYSNMVPLYSDDTKKQKAYMDEADRSASNLCYWIRQSNVTVFTVGFDKASTNVMLMLANDRKLGTDFNPDQPAGSFYYAKTPAEITNHFKAISDRIKAVLTQ